MANEQYYRFLNANAVKIIAIIAMTLDHLAFVIYRNDPTNTAAVFMRLIGRITCPVMCFFVVEGYTHTRHFGKYLSRMAIFAVLSHFAYVFAFNYQDPLSFVPFAHGQFLNQTGVIWGLLWGLILLKVFDSNRKWPWKILALLGILLVTVPSDWGCLVPLAILSVWLVRNTRWRQLGCLLFWFGGYGLVLGCTGNLWFGIIQMLGSLLPVVVLLLYNRQRGKSPRVNRFWQWTFYLYYPLHLVVIGGLAVGGVFA